MCNVFDSHPLQNEGIFGRGTVTPQNKFIKMMIGGFMDEAMNMLGESAAMACPKETA